MFELIIAFLLDLFLGDPPYALHPIRVIGGWIEKTEHWFRAKVADLRLAGLLQAVSIPLVVYAIVWFLTEVAFQINPLLKSVLVVYFLYSALSIKDLILEARRIHYSLRNGKLDQARQNLSRVVGRDTADLNEQEIIRGAIEAVAESFVDGIFAPLFYAGLGGAPLALAYKAVNTLDSMVGLRTSKYQEYGYWPAKIDEIINWLPARISWFLIGLAAFFVNGRAKETWHMATQYIQRRGAANGTIPEAAFAGALGVELGGANSYGGVTYDAPKLGIALKTLEPSDIRRAVKLLKASSWVGLGTSMIIYFLSTLIFS